MCYHFFVNKFFSESGDKMENINLYLDSLIKIISSCAGEENNTFKINKNANSSLYIVVTSSLGLCGGYNYNIYKFCCGKQRYLLLQHFLSQKASKQN